MKKQLFFFYFLSVFISIIIYAQSDEYHIRNKVVMNNNNLHLSKMVVIMPLPQDNSYQSISNLKTYDGQVFSIPNSDNKYARWTYTGSNLPAMGYSKETYYDFSIIANSVNIDFSGITTIHPYDTSSNNFLWYTGNSGEYVVPNNPIIMSLGDSLWSTSTDIIDYARKAYLYVASNYSYLNPNTGIHTLETILSQGGGDCGNLSSIFVSLLRHKKIPAKHIVTVLPNGLYHVWADFYLENYGWIPVDVTFKNSNPLGDYFGKYDGSGIVVSTDLWHSVYRENNVTYNASLLQTFLFWIWSSSGNSYDTEHLVKKIPQAISDSVILDTASRSAVFMGRVKDNENLSLIKGFQYKKIDDPDWNNSLLVHAVEHDSIIVGNAIDLELVEYHMRAVVLSTNNELVFGEELPFSLLTSSITALGTDNLNITLYPNPAKNSTTIKINGIDSKANISIIDIQGRVVFSTKKSASNGEVIYMFDLDDFAKGVYYIRVNTDDNIKVQKLIIQ